MKNRSFRHICSRSCFITSVTLIHLLVMGQDGVFRTPDGRGMSFYHLTREQGLPSDFVMHAIQDFRGYVWIATDNGLARTDGKNITVFQSHVGKNHSIVDNYVIILKETMDSMLWIGTRNGISIYDPFMGTFKNFPLAKGQNSKFPGKFVRSIFEDNKGDMWIACNNGLVYSARGSDKFILLKLNWTKQRNIKDSEINFLTSVIADPRDSSKLFLGTFGGIFLFDKQQNMVVENYPKTINDRTALNDLYMDDEQRLWSCGWFTGLNCLDLRTGKWQEFPFNRKNPITILSILPKSKDEFWLSTFGMGLGLFNKVSGKFGFVRHDPLTPTSIISDNINHVLCFKPKHDLWTVGGEGISIENKKIFAFRQETPPFKFASITDIYRDKAAGRLYLGAFACDGLFVRDEFTGKWSIIREENPGPHQSLLINSFCRDKIGVLWLATNKNLMFLDTLNNRIIQFKTPEGSPLELKDSLINCVYDDPSGNLWIGTRNDGLIRINAERNKVFYYIHSKDDPFSLLEGTHHRTIRADKFNRIWIGNSEGVAIFEPEKDRFLNYFMDTLRKHGLGDKLVYNIENDTLGRMWMTIDGLGLLRVTMNDNGSFTFKLFETSQGLDASSISIMRRDKEGDFWINNVSLAHFNPYKEAFKLYDTQNGLHEMLGMGQKIYVDEDLNIFIAGETGYEVKNKHALEPVCGIISFVVEAVEINGSRINLGYKREVPHVFNLTAGENNVTFFFTVVCFDNISDIKYRYKLDGYDKTWYLSGSSREARYTNLPPGKFEFVFNVLNHPEFQDKSNSVLLIIKPLFWRTWWFITILSAVVLSLFYLAYYLRVRQLLRLEQLRSRIATDLHDDVGSTLSSISMLSEMMSHDTMTGQSARMLKTIGDSSSQMMEKLDDIVWVVNPSNDKFRDLGLRIREFAIPLCESKNIGFSISYDEQLSGVRLSMDIRRNVYLIAKEAINNAVKYSACSEVILRFKSDHHGLLMEISDDGKGFDPNLPTSRNGLQNMKLRARQIRSLITINSSHGKGTMITLMVKKR